MILITGATGLVGSHLAIRLLENGENVRAIYRNFENTSKTKYVFEIYKKLHLYEKIEWIKADITDVYALEAAFRGIQFVYHCAALISFDPKDEEKLRKTNIEGTANIVNFCLSNQIKKLCHVSSIAALGDLKINEKIITETTEWNPELRHSDYAISKYGAEMEIWRGQQEGLIAVIVNPGVVLGAGFENQSSSAIFTKVKNGLQYYTNGSTGFVSVLDLVEIMTQLMKFDVQGERFSVIAENCSLKQILFQIADEFKVKRPTKYVSLFATLLCSKIDWILSNLLFRKRKLSRDMALALHSDEEISNQKINDLLHYNFEKITLTIKKIVALQTTFTI